MSEDELDDEPKRIGRYRIVRPLSKGGMALVYEGRRESLGGVAPRVAIKVILPDYATSATFRELFINEARLGSAMQHQNLVQILDFDADGDRYFLVMEYVHGLTLSKMIGLASRHDVEVPMHVICEVGRQACEGLHYAHQAVDGKGRSLGLIHRDIKPSNVIVNDEGGVKILDFGISKGRLRAERSGSVKGTWGYMAPEQANGQRIGPNADVFGLGIVLYEMASRKSMFKGRKEEEIRQLLNDDHAARLTATLDPKYAPLASVLSRALARDPRQRFATAAELGRHLAEVLPDPVTTRQEMYAFYRRIEKLKEKETPKRQAPAATGDLTGGDTRKPQFTLDASRARDPERAMLLSALAGMVAVVAAFVLGYLLYQAFVPADPGRPRAGDGGEAQVTQVRPVPLPEIKGGRGAEAVLEPVAPTPPPPVEDDDADPDPDAEVEVDPLQARLDALDEGEALVGLDTRDPDTKIYLNGELVPRPYEAVVVPAGRQLLDFVTADGIHNTVSVEVDEGTFLQKRFDADTRDFY